MTVPPHVLVPTPLGGLGVGGQVAIPPATLHHLRRVLRLTEGTVIRVTDGAGRTAAAELSGAGARLSGAVHGSPPPTPRLVLAQALSKGRRAEDAVRMACELGVDRVVPVVAERTQGRPDARAADAVVERWRAVAVAALEQSRGDRLADVVAPVTTAALLVAPSAPDGLRLIAVPGAPALPDVLGAGARPAEVVVAIGPEGGWSDGELAAAVEAGWSAVGLGSTILRTEHAGPVALAVVAALAGRWRTATLAARPSRSSDAL